MSVNQTPRCINLVLDAGPLLSLSPLRSLAETYYTVPQVLSELKDRRAREHFEKLALNSGVKIEVKAPDAAALSHVIKFAKQTGDYAVLSHADLCVLALTYALDSRDKRCASSLEPPSVKPLSATPAETAADNSINELAEDLTNVTLDASEPPREVDDLEVGGSASELANESQGNGEVEERDKDSHREDGHEPPSAPLPQPTSPTVHPSTLSSTPLFDDPSDSDDGEGEWITPSNVAIHKSRAFNLLPPDNGKGKAPEVIQTGCMTADFAMQNVLLQMGLNLVSVDGKRIDRIKTWVLRCHACFKICKDSSKKFCPSCGNPTLLRASVTVASPTASKDAPAMTVHLKKNYQYRNRGTKYPIPMPKSGSSKGGSGEGLILREDQTEWLRATKRAEDKRAREEQKLIKGMLSKEGTGHEAVIGTYLDPLWVPEILTVGAGGKGRTIRSGAGHDSEMPEIGYGRRNPNQRRRTKK